MTALELSIAFQTNKTPAEYVGLGRLVDGFEFDVVSVYHDLLFQPSLGPLVLLAQHVHRARLGPAALNPFALHPLEIAGQVAFLDTLTAGRAYFGLARGSWLEDNRHSDVATDYPSTRMCRGGSLSTERT